MESVDSSVDQAMGILTSSALADALDLSQEDPAIVARYGESNEAFQRDGAPQMVENFCVARRLVEAGARFVSLNYSRWDWHGGDGMNYPKSREEFPKLDKALAALRVAAVKQNPAIRFKVPLLEDASDGADDDVLAVRSERQSSDALSPRRPDVVFIFASRFKKHGFFRVADIPEL